MVQKLLILERNSKDELQEAIEKNVLQQGNMRLISFSVLEQFKGRLVHENQHWFEAWCVVDVAEKQEKFYNTIMGLA